MSDVAKLFKSGGSQAVRLPKEYRFAGEDELLIYREGHRIVLESRKASWSERFLALAGSAPEFPYPVEPPGSRAWPRARLSACTTCSTPTSASTT